MTAQVTTAAEFAARWHTRERVRRMGLYPEAARVAHREAAGYVRHGSSVHSAIRLAETNAAYRAVLSGAAFPGSSVMTRTDPDLTPTLAVALRAAPLPAEPHEEPRRDPNELRGTSNKERSDAHR